jgi:hypothetical protein
VADKPKTVGVTRYNPVLASPTATPGLFKEPDAVKIEPLKYVPDCVLLRASIPLTETPTKDPLEAKKPVSVRHKPTPT